MMPLTVVCHQYYAIYCCVSLNNNIQCCMPLIWHCINDHTTQCFVFLTWHYAVICDIDLTLSIIILCFHELTLYVVQCGNLNLIMPMQCSVSVTCHCPPISLAFPWSHTSTIKCFFSVLWHASPSGVGSHISHQQVLRLCLLLLSNVAGSWSEVQYSLLSIQVQYSL